MTTRAGIQRTYESSFLLDEARLRKVANVFDEFGKRLERPYSVHFEVQRADSSFYETEDIGVVLEDDNTSGKQIRSVVIRLLVGEQQDEFDEDDDREVAARVTFGHDKDDWFFGRETRVRFVITEKGRDWCFLFADELDTQIRRTLTHQIRWFPARSIDVVLGLGVIALLVIVALPLVGPTDNVSAAQLARMSVDQKLTYVILSVQKRSAQVAPVIVFFVFITLIFFVAVELRPITRIRNWMNQPVFYWGDFTAIHDRSKARTSNVIWVVIVGFLISIVASIAYTWVTTKR